MGHLGTLSAGMGGLLYNRCIACVGCVHSHGSVYQVVMVVGCCATACLQGSIRFAVSESLLHHTLWLWQFCWPVMV